MTLALSIRYFFGIEEENVKKSRILWWITEENPLME
jgi:hypothetical protein